MVARFLWILGRFIYNATLALIGGVALMLALSGIFGMVTGFQAGIPLVSATAVALVVGGLVAYSIANAGFGIILVSGFLAAGITKSLSEVSRVESLAQKHDIFGLINILWLGVMVYIYIFLSGWFRAAFKRKQTAEPGDSKVE